MPNGQSKLFARYSVEAVKWKALAKCRGMNPDLFHPGRGGDPRPAKSVCRECPVREQCLEHALRYHEKHGVWGGETERARRRIRKVRSQV